MFEALLGASQDGITLTAIDGSIIRVIRGILGYVPRSLKGMRIEDLVHREERDQIHDCYREVVLGRTPRAQGEARVQKEDGSWLWVEFTLIDMLDNPDVMAVVCSYRDVSWRRLETMTRRLAEAELAALASHTSTAVFSVDQAGAVQTWHPCCESLLGYTAAEIEGSHVHSLVPAALEGVDRAGRTAVIESGQPSEAVGTQLVARNGQAIPVQLVLAPLVLNNAVRAVAYIAEHIV
jgi:PAS domain S-box-containing protein